MKHEDRNGFTGSRQLSITEAGRPDRIITVQDILRLGGLHVNWKD
jgi:hypothetical protein